jgi:isopentenyl diphosphate isomerase/L-lactate dehydrogenase-like FMN-dependent dehydrogenase
MTTMPTPAPLCLRDFEPLAAAVLPAMAYDYYRSGACDERTLRRNEAAFDELAIRYRVLVDVSARSATCALLGSQLSMPVLIAPTAFQRMAHPEGELATARAAADAGTIMVLSTLSNTAIEDVAPAAQGALWFQLYVYRDRGATRALLDRVRAAGARALVLTVDAPLLGRRERDVRNAFALPDGLVIANAHGGAGHAVRARDGGSGLAEYFASLLDPSLTFRDLEWLCGVAGMPVLVKGVVRGDDALRVLDHGAAGVIVSNHGGRQLDGSVATIEALPEVVRTVAGRAPVLLDGGVRRGTDVLKALALGAQAVLLGRPILWGLASAGQAGVTRVLELLRAELDLALALAGCPTLADIRRDLVAPAAPRRDPSLPEP